MDCSLYNVYSTLFYISLFPNSFLDKELGISASPTPCLRQHFQSSARAKKSPNIFGASTSFRQFWKWKRYLWYLLRKKKKNMENSKFTRNPAWVYKSEPSSHFVTDIYLPSVRLQQSNSREEELEQIKITFQHYLLPSHMRSQTFNGYFKLQHFLSIQWPESSFFFFSTLTDI